MFAFSELVAWSMLGVLAGFTGGYASGFKEGKREGFIRGRIAASRKAVSQ